MRTGIHRFCILICAFLFCVSLSHGDEISFPENINVSCLKDPAEGNITCSVTWVCSEPVYEHKPWKWNPGLQIYQPGTELEDTLAFIWRKPGNSTSYDIWIWRAGRSAGIETADDLHAKYNESGQLTLSFDSGVLPWRISRPPLKHEGDILPRYSYVRPFGSAADVSVKATYENGHWNIVLKRVVDTGNSDDIPFGNVMELYVTPEPLSRLNFPELPYHKVFFLHRNEEKGREE